MAKAKTPKLPQSPAKIVVNFELLMDVLRSLLEEKIPFIFHHSKHSEAVSFSVTKQDYEAAAAVAPEVFTGKPGKLGTTVYVYLDTPKELPPWHIPDPEVVERVRSGTAFQ